MMGEGEQEVSEDPQLADLSDLGMYVTWIGNTRTSRF